MRAPLASGSAGGDFAPGASAEGSTMKWRMLVGSVGAFLTVVGVPVGVSEAAKVPRIPITCGMVVEQDAYLYLQDDLTCATQFGISVTRVDEAPQVTIDLRGHTLRGPGSGYAIRSVTSAADGSR